MANKEVTLADFYDEFHSLVEEGLVSNAVAAYERAGQDLKAALSR